MKKLFILIPIILSMGCEGYLDEEPVDFLSDTQFYQTEEDALAVVNAAYEPFATNSYYGQQFFAQVEMKAEYCLGRGSHQPSGVYQLDQRNIGRIAGIWQSAYLSINRANATIARVPNIAIDEDLKTRIVAEAHFVRALNYFNLVRLWGPVPLQEEEVAEIVAFSFPRAPVNTIYELILEDLEVAEAGLRPKSEQNAPIELFRATIGAAQLLLADVYLTLERYDEAQQKAQEVIKGYSDNLLGSSGSRSQVVQSTGDEHDLIAYAAEVQPDFFFDDVESFDPGHHMLNGYSNSA